MNAPTPIFKAEGDAASVAESMQALGRAAKSAAKRPGLVGAFLDERHERALALRDSGTAWVPFNRDHLERAVRWASTSVERRDDFEFRDMAW